MKLSLFKQNKSVELAVDINSLEGYRAPGNRNMVLYKDKRSYLDGEGHWNVYPIAYNSVQVFVVCPHCGGIHMHGRGQAPEYRYQEGNLRPVGSVEVQGHRTSQCLVCNNNGYIILRGNHA